MRTLLNQRADVKAVQPDGASVLHWAAHWDDVEMAGWLIDAGARLPHPLGAEAYVLPHRSEKAASAGILTEIL